MIKRILITVFTVALVHSVCFGGIGTTSMDILKVPAGIRSQAMGGAYIAVSDDLEALDMNPGGLGLIEKNSAMFIHDLYLQDVFFDSVYFASILGDFGTLGFAIKYLSAGTITQTLETDTGTYAGEGDEVTGYNYLVTAGLGFGLQKWFFNDFTRNVDIGIDLKLSGESLGDEYSNMAVSTDIGAIYTIVIEEVDFMTNRGEFVWNKAGLGIVFKNLGTSFEAATTPISIAFGAYTQMVNAGLAGNRIRLSADTDYNIDTGINLRTGIEYYHIIENYNFAFRAGGNINPSERIASGFSAGGGAGIKSDNFSINIDYVFMPFGELGTSQKIGLYIKY